MSAKRKDLSQQRATVRKLMAEQSEFPIVTPPQKYKQEDFPLGSMRARDVVSPKDRKRERLTKKLVPFTAGAQ